MNKYDITDYLKDDKELQKAVIDEFLKEIAELKALKGLITVGSKQQYQCLQKIDELEQENERLKAEITELEEKFLTLNGKSYSYYLTLQEIKAIAEECTTCGDCCNCKYCEDCDTDLEEQALGVCRMILDLITKAEVE